MTGAIGLITGSDPQVEHIVRGLGRPFTFVPETSLRSLAKPSAVVPALLLADVRERPRLLADLGAVRRQHPSVGIVIIARLDPKLMLEAMRAGITECVTEPIEPDQLKAALARVTTQAPASRGEVFAFLGSKGGVGTTTLAVNVASVLAKTGEPVLFADLNVAYGDAALYLGAEPRFSIIDALENTSRLDFAFLKNILASTSCKVELLASADRDPGRPVDFRGVHNIIDLGAHHYRYVVLDVPRSGRAVVDPLEKADAIIVVSNHELSAVRSASHIASILRGRYGSARVSVVVSRFDSRSEISSKDIEAAVGERIRQTFPSDYRLALDALNKGRPLVLENHTKLAATIHSFAKDLAKIPTEVQPEEPKSGGFLSRLTDNTKLAATILSFAKGLAKIPAVQTQEPR